MIQFIVMFSTLVSFNIFMYMFIEDMTLNSMMERVYSTYNNKLTNIGKFIFIIVLSVNVLTLIGIIGWIIFKYLIMLLEENYLKLMFKTLKDK